MIAAFILLNKKQTFWTSLNVVIFKIFQCFIIIALTIRKFMIFLSTLFLCKFYINFYSLLSNSSLCCTLCKILFYLSLKMCLSHHNSLEQDMGMLKLMNYEHFLNISNIHVVQDIFLFLVVSKISCIH